MLVVLLEDFPLENDFVETTSSSKHQVTQVISKMGFN